MNFEKNIARYSGELFTAFGRQLERAFREQGLGISPDQFRMLTHLWNADGIAQQALAAKVRRDRASVARIVDILEREGFATRIPDAVDRRVNLVYLTKQGKALQQQASACAAAVVQKALAGFAAAEVEQAESLMLRMIENLGK
ncbi:hypothetical protein GCM10023185_15330 [Hymenobacter saemangeumensis]|uniref:HTH marR-type domain-containing protein n=1 Tax=Hymenobacter saemangeumensis TaxID=1084522 RepID=A0ABP8I9B1_9BACT